MKHKWVITIGREYCSGGAATGRAVAEALGIAYYDRSIVDEAADLAKIDAYTASKLDEKPVSYVSMASSLMSYSYNNYFAGDPDLMLPVGLKIAAAQSQVMLSAQLQEMVDMAFDVGKIRVSAVIQEGGIEIQSHQAAQIADHPELLVCEIAGIVTDGAAV